jgi:tetrahydromethanopterin S-methyltransferase subunit G
MSMYTHLLDAALEQRPTRAPDPNPNRAVEEVRRRRDELERGVQAHNPDVPAVLALQIGYDVALLELAAVVGIESGSSWFDQPERERDRLLHVLHDMGIDLDVTNAV